ncbi:hypothetical protein FA15DRAFT_727550 [Coprinopsis marcescibilis]|uniref:G-protein coupled receptors family 1 profile domain-containing protein n=1 Tax=Coprinopsis marcescibilis TaxID=230819 RepID=A0A5C3KFX4_COPMA|nr:hypothetical protein FA15DRAFT_727550 [Coprinopsis marcescibilis]
MSPVWTKEYTNEYGLVYLKAQYANYVITMATVGIQLFMNSYALVVFFETPAEKRLGRALYMVSGWMIFIFYAVGASFDMARMFRDLLEASNGIEYMEITSSYTWMEVLNLIAMLLVFVVGDGLLLYRCYLLLAVGRLWLLALPVLMYMSVIALSISNTVLALRGKPVYRTGLSSDILTFMTNFLITSMLCYKLWSSHRDFARSLPLASKRLGIYRAVIRILVESALPLTVAGIINVTITYIPTVTSSSITVYPGDPKALVVAYECVAVVHYALQALAPQMIIFRVTTGRSWARANESSAEALSLSLAFARGPHPEDSTLSVRLAGTAGQIAEEGWSGPHATPISSRSGSTQGM